MELGSPAFWDLLTTNPSLLAKKVAEIDLIDLERTLQEHPGLRAWVGAAYETARIREEEAKWGLTKAKARAFIEAKKELDPDTGKWKSVATLEAERDLSEEVNDATNELHEAQALRGSLRAISDALQDRRDMLIQISARQRQEAEEFQRPVK